jgi:hypothetical protein
LQRLCRRQEGIGDLGMILSRSRLALHAERKLVDKIIEELKLHA